MARILICHVPKDGSLARDLGATLMGRGHFVSFDGEPDSPRADRSSRLRQFEAVAVLWTDMSAQSAGLSDIARETMPLNLLVSVRADELAVAKLPLMFRKLNMLSPRDVDGIARLVARLSAAAASLRDMTEGDAQRRSANPPAAEKIASQQSAVKPVYRAPPSEPVAPPSVGVRARPLANLPEVEAASLPRGIRTDRSAKDLDAPSSRAQGQGNGPLVAMTVADLAAAIDTGLLVHHIPPSMWLGTPVTVEIALNRDMLTRLPGARSIETLSISLYGSADAIDIERRSERTQFIAPRPSDPERDPATLGRWAWLVTPHAPGAQELIVRVGALLRDRNGVPGPVAIPDTRFSVEIQLSQGQNLISALAGWRPR